MTDSVAAARADSIGQAIRRAAAIWGRREALKFGTRTWSFYDLDRAADRVAAWMADSLGVQFGDRIACWGRNSDAYLLAWLGCVRGGFIHVPINYALLGDELAYILEQSAAEVLLFGESQRKLLPREREGRTPLRTASIDADVQSVLAAALADTPPAPVGPSLSSESLAQIMYTSGTTSAPKGAMMSHGAMLAQYASCVVALDYERDDRSLAALPLYHTAQLQAFCMPQLLAGMSTVLLEAPEPAAVLATIASERISSFFAPPTVWISLLRHPDWDRVDLSSLRKVYYGASIMPGPILRELRERLPQAGAYNVYGQTEIAPVATVLRPEDHVARPTSVGRPVLNVMTRVVDADMNDAPAGRHGEIVHRSPQLCSGYWDNPTATAEAFAGGWFHSGDVGYRDEEGYFYIVDRLKDVINTGGVLVASREVEDAIFDHPAVSEVAVIGVPHPKWIEAITAVVVLRDGKTCSSDMILAHARRRLAPYKAPKSIIFLSELPKNASGKVLKRELRLQVGGRGEAI